MRECVRRERFGAVGLPYDAPPKRGAMELRIEFPATPFCRIEVLRKKFAMDVCHEPPAFCPEDWSSCDGSCVGFLAGVQCPVL